MRCPHCASPKAVPPICRACGSQLDLPPADERLTGLEIIERGASAPVQVEPLPGLEREGRSRASEEVVQIEQVPGIERVSAGAVDADVVAPLLPGLVLTETEIGADRARRAADVKPAGSTAVRGRCGRCGVGATATQHVCAKCGGALPWASARAVEASGVQVVCLVCSVPNPRSRVVCMACNNRL